MKILVIASGGDAPGMNMILATLLKKFKSKIFAVEGGFKGLYENKIFPLSNYDVFKYAKSAGCIIKSSRFPEFKEKKYFEKSVKNLQGFSHVIVMGGNGSYEASLAMQEYGIKTFFLPCTIDNDVKNCECSTGFLTAVKAVCHTVYSIMPSMEAHNRCCIFEVMGRKCCDIAELSAEILQPDLLICNEKDLDKTKIAKLAKSNVSKNKSSFIILRENICDGQKLCDEINAITKNSVVKFFKIGHIQRGFKPTDYELKLAKKNTLKIIAKIV